jgi:endo-alpha-1,4-polygalactosaminidase (GH114 family)
LLLFCFVEFATTNQTTDLNNISKKINKNKETIKKQERRIENANKIIDLSKSRIDIYEEAISCLNTATSKIEKNQCKEEMRVSIKDLKKKNSDMEVKDIFYFLGKDTNNLEKYPKYKYQIITIDMEDSTTEEIIGLKDRGYEVYCYISAGTYESWRSDADNFPEEIKGKNLENWDKENWLDISSPKTLEIMKARIERAADKGCNGVDFDNVDGYTNNTGFELSAKDQLNYNIALAKYAKEFGLKTALKNDLNQVNDLMPYYDIAINESCNKYNECDMYTNWLNEGKIVYNIEYTKPKELFNIYKNFKTYLMDEDLSGKKYRKF